MYLDFHSIRYDTDSVVQVERIVVENLSRIRGFTHRRIIWIWDETFHNRQHYEGIQWETDLLKL